MMTTLAPRCAAFVAVALVTSVAIASDAHAQVLDERIPDAVLEAMKASKELVAAPSLAWTDRQIVSVAFNGGNDQIRTLIEKTAREWLDPSIPFDFSFRSADGKWRTWSRKDRLAKAAIRIDFSMADEDGGYWSVVGRMATVMPPNQQTMNLGDLILNLPKFGDGTSTDWPQSYEHGTILHEFGHALGLAHEHFHPDCQADLKLDEAEKYLQGPPNNWTLDQAKFNIDAAYYFDVSKTAADSAFPKQKNDNFVSEKIDRSSVMLYALDPSFFENGSSSQCMPVKEHADALSDGDKAGFRRFYTKN